MASNVKENWDRLERRKRKARALAEEVLSEVELGNTPIDPIVIAQSERPLLETCGDDFGEDFDGRLEYFAAENKFLLFFNTKYDLRDSPGIHHPRTRFSIAHELGHYFLPDHRDYLMSGGEPHGSLSDFSRSDQIIENEADCFAASLLVPERLLRPRVNSGPLSFKKVGEICTQFNVSLTCCSISSVQVSDFPCALVAIKDGAIDWFVSSEPLIEAGFYPKRGTLSPGARAAWQGYGEGQTIGPSNGIAAGSWFETYDRWGLDSVWVDEEFLNIPTMSVVLGLLKIDEKDLTQS